MKYYFMKYDILVQTSRVHWFENNICQKKSPFLAQKLENFFFQNPFQAIIRLKKNKVAWTTKPLV